jgi:predicted dehydrogenase
MKSRHFPLGLTNDFALSQLDWLRAIEKGAQPECSGDQGLRDLACAYAVVESDQAGRKVTVEEVENGTLRAYQTPIDQKYDLLP